VHANASLDEMAAWLDQHLDVARYQEAEPDSNGLMFRSGQPGVTKFAVAVNTSLTTIVGAAKAGAQLLVVHHTTWGGIDLHLRQEKLDALGQLGVSLYAAHAALDCAEGIGNAWALAELLDVRVDTNFCEMYGGRAGSLGSCDGTFAELIQRASQELGVQVEAHQHAKTFGRVAIVPGAGGMTPYLDEARQLGADTYITGEGSMYTRMFAKETGLNLIMGTHQATEAPGIKALGRRLSDHAQIPFEFIPESSDVF
jgi:dinuclear metal center YbgI/SA1388 family protein